MNIYHFTPYSLTKDLGAEYNRYMEMIGEDDVACIRDGDTMFLTPDFGSIIFDYAYQNPNAVMTCYCNRIHSLAQEQMVREEMINWDIESQIYFSTVRSKTNLINKTTPLTGPLSGFLMLIPKKIWQRVKFREGMGLLGVDTWFYKNLRTAGIPILRMDGLYIWHTYRLGKDIADTTHLKTSWPSVNTSKKDE